MSNVFSSSYFSDTRGIAKFDNIFIKSDSIDDQRFDKVMPLWPEEHLVTASVLKAIDLKNKTVLDIGCGSGVFSILCAKHGAAVVSLDCSARAISATIANANLNSIRINSTDEPIPEQILLKHCRIGDTDIDQIGVTDGYDIVIITPPYNPGFNFLSPAAHAAAGPDGQSAFEIMVGPAIKFLSEDGIFVCNHMSSVSSNGTVHAETEIKRNIKEAFGKSGFLTKHLCLEQGRVEVRQFLNNQYKNIRRSLEWKDSQLSAQLQYYINKVANEISFFELATYVASPSIDVRSLKTIPKSLSDHATLAGRGWTQRMELHARIVESAVPNLMFQLPSLHSNTSRYGGAISEGADQYTSQSLRYEVRERIGLDLAGIQSGNGENDHLLDLVIVDAAPLADHVSGQAELSNEVTFWMSPRLQARLNTIGDAHTELIELWQANTRIQQRIKTGPFLHPWFTGATTQSEWTLFQMSTRLKSTDGSIQDNMRVDNRVFDLWCDALESSINENSTKANVSHSDGIGYYGESLGALQVDEPSAYIADIFHHQRLDIIWSHLIDTQMVEERDHDILKNLKRKTSEFLKKQKGPIQLQKILPNGSREIAIISSILQLDGQFCHSLMHRRLENLLRDFFRDKLNLTWSSMAGMPLRIRNLRDRRENGLPYQYRGGVWTFCASMNKDGINNHQRLERQSFDISKSVWLNYMDRYGLESAVNIVKKLQYDSHHQIADALEILELLASQQQPDSQHLKLSAKLVKILFLIHSVLNGSLDETWKTEVSFDDYTDIAVLSACNKLEGLVDYQNENEETQKSEYLQAYEPLRQECVGKVLKLSKELRDLIIHNTDNLPENWVSIKKEPRFIIMFYSILRQAYFHAIVYALSNDKKGAIKISFEDKGGKLVMRISNSGIRHSIPPKSKDERILGNYTACLKGTGSTGPTQNENAESMWTTTTVFDKVGKVND